jgi:hypothetical protein
VILDKDVLCESIFLYTPDGKVELVKNAKLQLINGRKYGLIGKNGIGALVCCLLSVACSLLSAAFCLLPAVFCLLSAVCLCCLPTAERKLSFKIAHEHTRIHTRTHAHAYAGKTTLLNQISGYKLEGFPQNLRVMHVRQEVTNYIEIMLTPC